MIYYLTTAKNMGSIAVYLQTCGKALAGRFGIVFYEQLLAAPPEDLPRGLYIFTGLSIALGSRDPPSPAREQISRLRDVLVERHGPHCVLNDPRASLGRMALLRSLHARGINRFAAFQAGAAPGPERFPVFLREEAGSTTEPPALLRNRAELDAALGRRLSHDGLLAVEYCDTADAAGIYRKYGAFIVGGSIVPRHVFFSRHWLVKSADITGPEELAEELAYVESNPHAEALRVVARLANIGYGRIDYAVLDGRPQVWEINTSPTVMHPPGGKDAGRERVHERFTELFAAALDGIEATIGA